jgi:glycosidase
MAAFCHAQTPDWAKGAVWYQIFPERFRNGSPDNDPTRMEIGGDRLADWAVNPWTSDWYKLQPWEAMRNEPFYELIWDRRYGGDLLGVIEKLDYLQELDIDVIYFNPIFEAPSLHKYDATTYHHIDNNFGSDREGDRQATMSEKEDPSTWTLTSADRTFLELIRKAHDMGIRIVIDGVFNHSGPDFWALGDVWEKQQNSKYKDWFDVTSWDDPATDDTNEFDYKGWWGYKAHPEFKEDENGFTPGVKEYFFDITQRWMDPNGDGDPADGIDGWRLDVAEDVNTIFWEEWYQHVKSINPDAYIVGEIWHEALEFISKKRFDALMNYPFAQIVVDFFIDQRTKISVSEFDERLKRLRSIYPKQTNHIMMNLIDSHDTDRLASMIKNPDRDYNQQQGVRHNPKYDPRKPTSSERRVQKLIAIFQLTYLGAPMIYYGDEAGMWGGGDPDERKPMLWDDLDYENETYQSVRPDLTEADENRFDPDLFNHYRTLIKIRKGHPAIQKGDFVTRLTDNERELYAFSRKFEDNEILVVLNNSEEKQSVAAPVSWKNGTKVKELWTGKYFEVEKGKLNLTMKMKWGIILAKES